LGQTIVNVKSAPHETDSTWNIRIDSTSDGEPTFCY